jgi:histidine triad (HIT) family protein
MNNDTIFQKIIKKEIPSVIVYEDDICIVIMDKFPSTEGQTLVIPKEAVDYVFDLNDETYNHILSVAKKVVKATDKALKPFRTCLVIEGFDVPHAHIKIYPVKEAVLSTKMGEEKTDQELKKVAEEIKKFL